jgi:site-specific DNA-cytosine methylase
MKFQFPKPTELKIFIKDILEPQVDSKYYLSPKLQERFAKYLEEKNKKLGNEPAILDLYNHKVKEDGTSITLSNPCHNNLRLIESSCVAMRSYPRTGPKEQDGDRIQNIEPRLDGCSNTLSSVQKDNLVFDKATNKITEEVYEVNEENDIVRPSYIQYQNGNHSEAHRVYNSDGISQSIKPLGLKVYDAHRVNEIREYENIANTLSQAMGTGGNNVPMISNCSSRECGFKEDVSPTLCSRDYKDPKIVNQGQLRRLTPKECFRLMGFFKDEININGLTIAQSYDLVGNGWDINIASKIFKRLYNDKR